MNWDRSIKPTSTGINLCAFAVFGLMFTIGCGKTREFGSIKGKVTIGGKPLTAGRVILAHDEGPMAAAEIDGTGSYAARVAQGKTKISIDHHEKKETEGGAKSGVRKQEIIPGKSLVPEKYAQAKTSGLEINVVAGENVYDINMLP